MISERFPYLPVVVILGGNRHSGEALADTGFNADIVVPASVDLGPSASVVRMELGDGSEVRALRTFGYIQVGDLEPVPAEIIAIGDNFVIGILSRYEVILDHGQRVIVNP